MINLPEIRVLGRKHGTAPFVGAFSRGCLLALMLASAALPAQAEQRLHLDFQSLTRIALQYARPSAPAEHTRAANLVGPLAHDVSSAPAISLAPEPADPLTAPLEDVAAGHRMHWHYDEQWSGTLSSDYPQFALPVYLVGNGAPGVPQRVWLQLTFARSF